MDSRGIDRIDEVSVAETPEDVAVLYSWANLHGAKYRDFSASRREYRAQLRHRAAEQVREQALLAQAEAEAAAIAADSAARHAAQAARTHQAEDADSSMRRALREAEEAARTAAAERVEAARRAEAAAVAEAAARREEREIAEAHASAQRQAARYAESEIRRKAAVQQTSSELPGQITDPYTIYSTPQPPVPSQPALRPDSDSTAQQQFTPTEIPVSKERREYIAPAPPPAPAPVERRSAESHQSHQTTTRRPQGYRPDDASGVRQIYRGPEYDAAQAEYTSTSSVRPSTPGEGRAVHINAASQEIKPVSEQPIYSQRPPSYSTESQASHMAQRRNDPPPSARSQQAEPLTASTPPTGGSWPPSAGDRSPQFVDPAHETRDITGNPPPAKPLPLRPPATPRTAPPQSPSRPVSPFSQALVPSDATRGRRAQDDFDYQQSQGFPEPSRRPAPEPLPESSSLSSQRPAYPADPAGPAWLYAPPAPQVASKPLASQPMQSQSSVADTLQHSRERVAARWFALKGVFEQPGQEQAEAAPVRQKETRTPVLAVFSLAGGVGKTSLVATVGRSLSSMGEKVLLTDTTSHGLLPFYFGASELRQGTVRTFSPPSGSTDAPIYLVSYDVDQKGSDEAAQEQLAEEIINNSRGTHRILLDLTVSSSWVVRRLSRMNPTMLVPVAPDMNSVISLQTVEKFFSGVNDGDGRPLQPYYVLNQFDSSLPLHLDVREVMRRQLGDRLLPFVIRRAPAVSEALAEGMTVVDYAPDAPVAEDYLNLATWLRTVAAPATAGFRNVRWSER
jgi:cellulose synthase operon protein YhjQ